jgi:hypothetical protein
MSIGTGKYDAEAVRALRATHAHGILLIVIGGQKGSGFSVVMTPEVMLAADLPTILRNIADQIDTDIATVIGPTS